MHSCPSKRPAKVRAAGDHPLQPRARSWELAYGGLGRSDIQNRMGSALSNRRGGFPKILQHDTVLNPPDCGGPLVDLDGKAVGINIARAGRVESYTIPGEAITPLLADLQSGKLAPKTEPVEKKVSPVIPAGLTGPEPPATVKKDVKPVETLEECKKNLAREMEKKPVVIPVDDATATPSTISIPRAATVSRRKLRNWSRSGPGKP